MLYDYPEWSRIPWTFTHKTLWTKDHRDATTTTQLCKTVFFFFFPSKLVLPKPYEPLGTLPIYKEKNVNQLGIKRWKLTSSYLTRVRTSMRKHFSENPDDTWAWTHANRMLRTKIVKKTSPTVWTNERYFWARTFFWVKWIWKSFLNK